MNNAGKWTGVVLGALICAPASAASLEWFVTNTGTAYDYGRQLSIPAGFGTGEFTLELWIRPNNAFPFGPTTDGTAGQRTNWTDTDNSPYSSGDWWFAGNFLLDGHNNSSFADGTFSLQFYGSGRLRWLFGDGVSGSNPGGIWSVGAFPASGAPNVVDGQWHQISLVRRFTGVSNSVLELWIDGVLTATEMSTARTDMRQYWNNWSGFPAGQQGWFWGVEKQAAIGLLTQYEDYKGLLDELRFWSRAKSAAEIANNFRAPVNGNEAGLVGYFVFAEGSGSNACDSKAPAQCIVLISPAPAVWNAGEAPLDPGGDSTPPTVPAGLATTAVLSNRVELSWTASADNIGVVSYRVRRDAVTLSASITGTSYSDGSVVPSAMYTYSVSAADAAGNRSAESSAIMVTTPPSTDVVPPTVPGGLVATANSASQISLRWNAATDDVGVANYRVQRNGMTVSSGVVGTSFTDAGLAANTLYAYTVSAADAAGNRSTESAVTNATINTAPPPSGGGGSMGWLSLLGLLVLALSLVPLRRVTP